MTKRLTTAQKTAAKNYPTTTHSPVLTAAQKVALQKKVNNNTENYKSPCCVEPEGEQLKNTCHPLTPYLTKSFEMAREIRTPYDQYWLRVYNTHSLNENYNLP